MRIIKLTQGKFAIVDDDDYERLSSFAWYAWWSGWTWYARISCGTYMHKFIVPDARYIDHKNRNGLDNRKKNLRPCTNSQNNANKLAQSNNKTGYKGVSLCSSTGRYRAQLVANGTRVNIGRFDTAEEAARAYDKKAIEHCGEFAFLNFP